MELKKKALNALLALQRYSWEQGVTVQACFEAGETELLKQLVKASVYRVGKEGRVAQIGRDASAVDACSVGEGLLYVANTTKDEASLKALKALLIWAIKGAPRNENGIVYHMMFAKEFWSDTVYMLPPFFAAAGCYKEAVNSIWAYVDALKDMDTGLCRHIWNDDQKEFSDENLWGVGNGWILAGIARVIDLLPDSMNDDKEELIRWNTELLDNVLRYRTEDNFFHNVLDDNSSFVEINLSQMVAYTIYRGIKSGWLSERYMTVADELRLAAEGCVDADGFIQPVCGMPSFDSAGIAPEGQAFFVLMEAAYDKLSLSGVI